MCCFRLLQNPRVNQNCLEYTEDNTWPCKTFKEVMDYVLEIDEDYDQPFDMDEIDEFDDFWYIVEWYTLREGKYDLDAWFCMSTKGKVWSVVLYSKYIIAHIFLFANMFFNSACQIMLIKYIIFLIDIIHSMFIN